MGESGHQSKPTAASNAPWCSPVSERYNSRIVVSLTKEYTVHVYRAVLLILFQFQPPVDNIPRTKQRQSNSAKMGRG